MLPKVYSKGEKAVMRSQVQCHILSTPRGIIKDRAEVKVFRPNLNLLDRVWNEKKNLIDMNIFFEWMAFCMCIIFFSNVEQRIS